MAKLDFSGISDITPTAAPGMEDLEARRARLYDKAEEPEWAFAPLERIKKSAYEQLGTLSGLAAMTAESMGLEGGRDYFLGKTQSIFETVEKDFGDLVETRMRDIDSPLDVAKFGTETLIEYIPTAAMMFLGGSGGAAIAGRVAAKKGGEKAMKSLLSRSIRKNYKKQIDAGIDKVLAKKIALSQAIRETGALAGMAAYEGGLGVGGSYLYDVELRGVEEASPLAALATGTAQATLTYLSPINRFLGSKIGGKVMTAKGARDFATMTIGEAAEEVGQELISMAHEAGINKGKTFQEILGDPDSAWRLAEAGAAGMIVGGFFGGVRKVTAEPEVEITPIEDAMAAPTLDAEEEILDDTLREGDIDPVTGGAVPKEFMPSTPEEAEFQRVRREAATRERMMGRKLDLARRQAEAYKVGEGVAPPTAPVTMAPVSPAEVPGVPVLEYPEEAYQPTTPEELEAVERQRGVAERQARERAGFEVAYREEAVPAVTPPVTEAIPPVRKPEPEAPLPPKVGEETFDIKLQRAMAQTEKPLTRSLIENDQESIQKQVNELPEGQQKKAIELAYQEAKIIGQAAGIQEYVDESYDQALKGLEKPTIRPKKPTRVEWRRSPEITTLYEGTHAGIDYVVMEADNNELGNKWRSYRKEEDGTWTALGKVNKTFNTAIQSIEKALPEAGKVIKVAEQKYTVDGKIVEKTGTGNNAWTIDGATDGFKTKKAAIESIIGVPTKVKVKPRPTKKLEELVTVQVEKVRKPKIIIRREGKILKVVSAADVIAQVSKSKDKVVSSLGKAIKHVVSAEKLEDIKVKATPDAGAYYNTKSNSISLPETSPEFVKLHEIIHSVTAREMEANPAIAKRVTNIREKLSKHAVKTGLLTEEDLKHVMKDSYLAKMNEAQADIMYALRNNDEMLAVGMTSANVRDELLKIPSKIPARSIRLKTLWGQFIDILGSALGLSKTQYTQLDRLLTTFGDLATASVTEEKITERKIPAFFAGIKGMKKYYGKHSPQLMKAEEMLNQGIDMKTIKKETGWYRWADQMWRYIIPTRQIKTTDMLKGELSSIMDSNMRDYITVDNQVERAKTDTLRTKLETQRDEVLYKLETDVVQGKLSEFVDYSSIHEIYGDVFDGVDAEFYYEESNAVGEVSWNNFTNKYIIKINEFKVRGMAGERGITKDASRKEALLHEMQHVIQIFEEFSQGTSPEGIGHKQHRIMFQAAKRILKDANLTEDLEALKEVETEVRADSRVRGEKLAEWSLEEFFIAGISNEANRLLKDDTTFTLVSLEPMAHTFYEATLGEMEARAAAETAELAKEELVEYIPSEIYIDPETGFEIPGIALVGLLGGTVTSASIAKNTIKVTEKTQEEKDGRALELMQKYSPTAAIGGWKDVRKGVKGIVKNLAEGVRDRLYRIAPELAQWMRRFEFNLQKDEKRFKDSARPFIRYYTQLPHAHKLMVDYHLSNSRTEEAYRYMSAPMQIAHKKVVATLAELERRAVDVGLIFNPIKNYFPRRVKDMQGLIEFYNRHDPETSGFVQHEIKMRREAAISKGKGWTEGDNIQVINDILRGGSMNYIPVPGSAKERSTFKMSPRTKQYYADSATALTEYIYEMTEAVNIREMMGTTQRKRVMRTLRNISSKIGNLEAKPKRDPKQEKALKNLYKEWEELNATLETSDDALESSIAAIVMERVTGDKVHLQKEAIDLIRARAKQKGAYGVVNTVRNYAYMGILGSPISALTQLGDMAFSVYKNGPINSMRGFGRAVASKVRKNGITSTDFDFAHSTQDFPTGKSAVLLDKVLRLSGLKGMDLLGKETSLQSSYIKWKKVARKNDWKKFNEKWERYLGNNTRKTFNDLKAGKKTEDVLFMLYNDLADFQPIALSEMPRAYLEGGNLRVFYMLKTFSIKFLNALYREGHDEMMKGNYAKGAAKVSYLLMLTAMAGAGADELKNFIMGKDDSFSDNVIDNLIQLFLINKYGLEKGLKQDKLITTIVHGWMPPLRIGDDLATDLWAVIDEDKEFKGKTWRNVPVFGKVTYEHTAPAKEVRLAIEKRNIFERVRDGEKISDLRKDIEKYNKKAIKIGLRKEIIKYSQLNRIRKEALKPKKT